MATRGAHGLCAGTDKGDAVVFTGIDELWVFGQQPVARMDRIRAAGLCHADHLIDGKIGSNRSQPFANAIRFIRLEPVQAQFVLLGVDGNRFLAHLVGGAHHPDCDFAPVRDEDLVEFGHLVGLIWLVLV